MHYLRTLFFFFIATFACTPARAETPTPPTEDWPQWMGPQRDGIWRE